jgi:Peptidase family M50
VAVFPSQNPGFSDGEYVALAVAAALLFFASLLLHELGHALQARREGVEIEGINLWLFGGVAQFKGGFPSAGAEFRIAIAGPLVSLALGVLLVAAGFAGLPNAIEVSLPGSAIRTSSCPCSTCCPRCRWTVAACSARRSGTSGAIFSGRRGWLPESGAASASSLSVWGLHAHRRGSVQRGLACVYRLVPASGGDRRSPLRRDQAGPQPIQTAAHLEAAGPAR